MNEIFEIRRFGALARKWYRENMKLGIIFLGVMALLTFLCLCKFNPFLIEYQVLHGENEVARFILQSKEMHSKVFWGLFGLFAFVVALYSCRDFVVKDKIANTLLLPVSNLEKYLLAFLNSTVVVFILFLLLFYAVATVTNSFKYVGLNKAEFVEGGVFGNRLPARTPGQEIYHTEIGNVFGFGQPGHLLNLSYDQEKHTYGRVTPGLVANMTIIWFLYIVSLGMWGSITFRKHSLIFTFLIHVLYLLVLIAVSVWIGNLLFGKGPEVTSDTLSFYGENNNPDLPSIWWLLLFYIFPLAYQFVIWMKLKTKQIQ